MSKELENIKINISGKAVYIAVKEYLKNTNSDDFKKIIESEVVSQLNNVEGKIDKYLNSKATQVSDHWNKYWEMFIAKPAVEKMVKEAIKKELGDLVKDEIKKQFEPILRKEVSKRIKAILKVDEVNNDE